jgi:hypothetical protein
MHFQCFLTKGLGPLLLPPRFSAHCNNFHTSFTNCHASFSNYHTSSGSWHASPAMTKRLQPAWAPPEIPADQPKLELYNSLTRRKLPEFFLSLVFLKDFLAFLTVKYALILSFKSGPIFLCDFYCIHFKPNTGTLQ